MKKLFFLILSIFLTLSVLAEETNILPSEVGIVQSVQYVDTDENVAQTKQNVKIKLLSGEFKDETIELENILTGNPYYDINLKKGVKVILHAEDNGDGIE